MEAEKQAKQKKEKVRNVDARNWNSAPGEVLTLSTHQTAKYLIKLLFRAALIRLAALLLYPSPPPPHSSLLSFWALIEREYPTNLITILRLKRIMTRCEEGWTVQTLNQHDTKTNQGIS